MKKRVLIVFLSILTMMSCSACGDIIDRYHATPLEYEKKVVAIEFEDGTHCMEYMNAKYYPDDLLELKNGYRLTTEEDHYGYVFLSWNGSRWAYINTYYSTQAENPLFIYEATSTDLYLREDFDYRSELFVVDGTDAEIAFSEAFPSVSDEWAPGGRLSDTNLVMCSKTVPQLQVNLRLLLKDGVWCGVGYNDRIFTFSEELTAILVENEIIPQ